VIHRCAQCTWRLDRDSHARFSRFGSNSRHLLDPLPSKRGDDPARLGSKPSLRGPYALPRVAMDNLSNNKTLRGAKEICALEKLSPTRPVTLAPVYPQRRDLSTGYFPVDVPPPAKNDVLRLYHRWQVAARRRPENPPWTSSNRLMPLLLLP